MSRHQLAACASASLRGETRSANFWVSGMIGQVASKVYSLREALVRLGLQLYHLSCEIRRINRRSYRVYAREEQRRCALRMQH
jgi:hypothetical protein